MTSITIRHTEDKSIDKTVDDILDHFPDLPDRVPDFSIITGGGVVAGGRGEKSLKVVIEYDQNEIDEETLKEIDRLLAYVRTLTAKGIIIEQDK